VRRTLWLRFVVILALVTGAIFGTLAVGCGGDNGLVGGSCAQGYAPCGSNCCPVSTDSSTDVTTADGSGDGMGDGSDTSMLADGADATDGSNADRFGGDRFMGGDGPPDGTGGDAADGTGGDGTAPDAEGGIVCTPPLVDCNGMCVDLTSDPDNCGQCNNVCASVICQMSMCVGTTAGGIVYIGHDYLTTNAGTSQAHVLTNAVFIPQNSPLKVLSYERYASANAVSRVKAIINNGAAIRGTTVKITSTITDTDIPTKLVFTAFQVLVVQDQSTAPAGAMATLGTSWAATLGTFTQAGGIVIVLDGGTGVHEMPAFSTATALLSVTADAPLATGTQLLDVAPGDVVGVGVVSPYGAGKNSVTITTEAAGGNVVYVIEQPVDGGPNVPVVVHKAF
jgi:hypothetical protein